MVARGGETGCKNSSRTRDWYGRFSLASKYGARWWQNLSKCFAQGRNTPQKVEAFFGCYRLFEPSTSYRKLDSLDQWRWITHLRTWGRLSVVRKLRGESVHTGREVEVGFESLGKAEGISAEMPYRAVVESIPQLHSVSLSWTICRFSVRKFATSLQYIFLWWSDGRNICSLVSVPMRAAILSDIVPISDISRFPDLQHLNGITRGRKYTTNKPKRTNPINKPFTIEQHKNKLGYWPIISYTWLAQGPPSPSRRQAVDMPYFLYVCLAVGLEAHHPPFCTANTVFPRLRAAW